MIQDRGIEIWARPITPVIRADFSYAILFLNRRTDGTPSEVSVINRELGLTHSAGYLVEDLYTNKDYGILTADDKITVDVNPSGEIHVIRLNLLVTCNVCRNDLVQALYNLESNTICSNS